VRVWWIAALLCPVVVAASCGPSVSPHAAAQILLRAGDGEDGDVVEVTGISPLELRALDQASLTSEQWSDVFRVAIAPDAPAVLGSYVVSGATLRFTPLFPLDPGRTYHVRFDAGRVPGAAADAKAVEATVSHPAPARAPVTVVTAVYPSGGTVPANLLRMYVEFSQPMGRKSGVEHISLHDHTGREIPGAVLPLDYEFWSPDHTRFTIFLDPGRVKRGILPNEQMGRPLEAGRSITLHIKREWRDEHGLPLKEDFRREFLVGPPDEAPLDPASWRVEAPAAGGRGSLSVSFPKALDRGLLLRALGVERDGRPVAGEVAVERGETRWAFTPAEPWRPGAYHVLVLDILEDVAGNQIGRAFEVDTFRTVDNSAEPQTITIPFHVR
jgi:hypothetical protein